MWRRQARSKDQLGVEGKSVILTFGLLSPDKGIEHVIDAMPRILERFPETVYIVLGATHPHVKRAARRNISPDARESRQEAAGRLEHDLSQSVREPG